MIVVDLETSGVDLAKAGIWQIGAVDFENPPRIFLEEARIDNEDKVTKESTQVHGKGEKELRDRKKQSQKQLLIRFFKWCEKSKIKNFACQNPQFDVAFLEIKARKYGLKLPLNYHAFDLHSIAQTKYLQLKKKFLIIENRSGMGLSTIIKFCGLVDERKHLEKGKVVKEGKEHNALEDAKLTAECLSRILKGKNLLKEYNKFPIPKYLK